MEFFGQLRELAHPARFQELLAPLDRLQWVVYAKPPFGGPDQVLRYLARYTHRVAISNGRLLGLEEGRVRFRWRDSRDGNQIKEMSLDGVAFIRRFLLHVLPGGFVKIRHFGFLSNWNRDAMVEHCRRLLPPSPVVPTVVRTEEHLCPICKIGHMHLVPSRSAPPLASIAARSPAPLDSS